MKFFLFLGFFLSMTFAQNPGWLLGDWQAQLNDETLSFRFGQDASYTFIFSSTEEPDEGSWSLNGNNLVLESYIYENITYTLEQVSETEFNLSDGDLNGTLNFVKLNPLSTQPSNPLENQVQNPLLNQSGSEANWFLGEWSAVNGIQIITLKNNADGTYTFDVNDILNPYHEEGTWTLDGNQFTQKWKDPATGQDTQATYTIEKLSDNSFNQSGGNLEDTVFSFTRAGVDPLANLEDILSQSTEPQNPLDPGTASNPLDTTDTSGQTVTTEPMQPHVPPPATDPTVTRDFLIGDWVARDGSQVYSFNVRDSDYTWQISKWNGEVTYKEDAQWSLENGRLKQVWQNKQSGLTETAYYEPEKVSENTVRMRGGNFGLKTFLFHRVLENQISPLSSWLVGYWTSIVGIDSWGLIFQADGSYTLTVADFQNRSQTFNGNWRLERDQLMLSGDKSATYTLGYNNDLSIYLSGEDVGNNNLFQKANQNPRDPYQILSFVGQYIQQDSTLTLHWDGAAYGGTWLQKDLLYTIINAQATGDTLSFIAKGADGKEYAHTWRLDNNGLRDTITYNILTPFFQKISEGTFSVPNQLVGYWIQTEGFSQDDDLLLLPDGRYRQSSYFEVVGEVSQSVTEGVYKLENNQLILDPACSGPSTYTVTQVENHLLQSFVGFDGSDVTTTYMALLATAIDYQLAQVQLRDEIEARINAEWEQKIAFASVNTSIGRIPPSGEISADPFPEDIFANTTVFAEQQLYPYTSDYYYAYDTGGNYIQTSLNSQIIENMSSGGVKQDIDFSKGSYYDKLNRYFFPNGRTLQYYESYSTATSIVYPPKPTISYSWSKYKIEDGKIIVGDAEPLVYELINGRRHIRFEEECFENLKFSTANLKN